MYPEHITAERNKLRVRLGNIDPMTYWLSVRYRLLSLPSVRLVSFRNSTYPQRTHLSGGAFQVGCHKYIHDNAEGTASYSR